MSKPFLIFTAIGFLLISAVSASAMTVRAVAEPSLDNITVAAGSYVQVSILMNNNDGFNRTAMEMPFVFYSPDQSITDVTHLPIPGGQGLTHSVQFLNGFDEWWPLILDVYTFYHSSYSVLGVLPDTFAIRCSGTSGWPSGLGEQPYIRFYFDIEQEGTFCIDSCYVFSQVPHSYYWLFEDPVPSFNGPYCWNIEIVDDYICGDANHDGNINLLDITFLIKYLYGDGLMPYPFEAGDVNSSDSIEILDVAFMVNYLYKGGPGLHCIQ